MGMPIFNFVKTTFTKGLFSEPNWRDGKLVFCVYQIRGFQHRKIKCTYDFIQKLPT